MFFERGGGGYRAIPAVTWELGLQGLIRRTAPFDNINQVITSIYHINIPEANKKKGVDGLNLHESFLRSFNAYTVLFMPKRGGVGGLLSPLASSLPPCIPHRSRFI